MAYSYAKEKAYCEKRAQQFTAEMEAAIASVDKDRFLTAYQASARYMRKSLRDGLYRRFLAAHKAYREHVEAKSNADSKAIVAAYADLFRKD